MDEIRRENLYGVILEGCLFVTGGVLIGRHHWMVASFLIIFAALASLQRGAKLGKNEKKHD
jgi:hypothetical protein